MDAAEHTSVRPILWDSPLQYLKGVGPQRAQALAGLGITTVADLLLNLPRRYLDRSRIISISQVVAGQSVTVVGRVAAAGILKGRKNRFEVILEDGTGHLALVWFAGWKYLKNSFKRGDQLAVSGDVTEYRELQILHPECEFLEDRDIDDLTHTGRVIPIYPSGEAWRKARLDSRALRRILKPVVDGVAVNWPDYFDEAMIREMSLPRLGQALSRVHFPKSVADAEGARRRLAFDELFFYEFTLAHRRSIIDRLSDGRACASTGELAGRIIAALPWSLTSAQKRVSAEIAADLRSPRAMRRLLQGDVGSGKTIVAALAMAEWVESGAQAALLVPTEILAEQHHRTLTSLFGPLGEEPLLVTGSLSAADRRKAHQLLVSGDARVIVGTHALLSAKIEFADLGLAVIDEQHRFGVAQRQTLVSKGRRPDLLVMTATPIPRTLALTVYGDLDVSLLNELPPRKGKTQTVWRTEDARDKMYDYIETATETGDLVYIVYPLVEKSEKLDLKAAVAGYELLLKRFPARKIGLVHGRTSPAERKATMEQFHAGALDILVATTVIEVGVDSPNARLMIIENSERFGLSQLHQLRGRVGRGDGRSICVLMIGGRPTPVARERLETLCRTNDGFEVAEADLRLRGPGEFLGTRQHGLPNFRIADWNRDADLFDFARRMAFSISSGATVLSPEMDTRMRREWERRQGNQSDLLSAG